VSAFLKISKELDMFLRELSDSKNG